MFEVDLENNRLLATQTADIASLCLEERAHLQEWIEHAPEVLGEPLLVLSKEMGGFLGTRSRIDLLALDKAGRLVVVEIKGRGRGLDVHWQAARYAAYVAALDEVAIFRLYQRYLDKRGDRGDATARIKEFLGKSSGDNTPLNSPRSQRLVLISNEITAEVGATVLWLAEQGISVKLFQTKSILTRNSMLIDFEQMIPGPGEERFRPSSDRRQTAKRTQAGEPSAGVALRRKEFWTYVLYCMRESNISGFQNAKASSKPTMCGEFVSDIGLIELSVGMAYAKVSLRLVTQQKSQNEIIFELMQHTACDIEAKFGGLLNWHRPVGPSPLIVSYNCEFRTDDTENWPLIALWMVEHAAKLENAVSPSLARFASCVDC